LTQTTQVYKNKQTDKNMDTQKQRAPSRKLIYLIIIVYRTVATENRKAMNGETGKF